MEKYGADGVSIGLKFFEDTAKGIALKINDYFVKVILSVEGKQILGAHIIGPHASVLIHQIIPLMYTESRSVEPIMRSMDIHPSLSEVVTQAFYSQLPLEQYHHFMKRLELDD